MLSFIYFRVFSIYFRSAFGFLAFLHAFLHASLLALSIVLDELILLLGSSLFIFALCCV